jgi:RluA family pseudouridine synthase
VLYEDPWLIAFDKPSGLLSAPDRWDADRENLVRWVHERGSPDWFNVHRLERETSGVILFAKTRKALEITAGRFQSQDVTRQYVAITRGGPREDSGSISLALASDRNRAGRMVASPGGKPAETRFLVVTRWHRHTQLSVQPLTGRQHQIRVHLAAAGFPVLADSLYGSPQGLLLSELKRRYKRKKDDEERPLIGRLALHAASLTVRHPETDEWLTVTSPLPHDFQVAIKYLSRFAGVDPRRQPRPANLKSAE